MATPHVNLDERAKKSGIDPNAKDAIGEDDGSPDRIFSIHFKPYIEPKDIDSREETEAVDRENKLRYEYNLTQMPLLNVLLKRMNCSYKLAKPPLYYERANLLWTNKINEPSYKTVEAIRFMAKRGRYAGKDYPIEEAVKQAEDAAIQDFLEEKRRSTTPVSVKDISGVPKDHHMTCNCNYMWDGKSSTCMNRGVPPARALRLTWRTCDDFHFLVPKFEPFIH